MGCTSRTSCLKVRTGGGCCCCCCCCLCCCLLLPLPLRHITSRRRGYGRPPSLRAAVHCLRHYRVLTNSTDVSAVRPAAHAVLRNKTFSAEKTCFAAVRSFSFISDLALASAVTACGCSTAPTVATAACVSRSARLGLPAGGGVPLPCPTSACLPTSRCFNCRCDTCYIGTQERRSLCTLFPRVDLDLGWNQNTSSHRSDAAAAKPAYRRGGNQALPSM